MDRYRGRTFAFSASVHRSHTQSLTKNSSGARAGRTARPKSDPRPRRPTRGLRDGQGSGAASNPNRIQVEFGSKGSGLKRALIDATKETRTPSRNPRIRPRRFRLA